MCGIFGYYSFGEIKVDKPTFRKSLLTMIHRGPDFQQDLYYDDDKIGLGHTRLAIIDLSDSANQPMEIGKYHIVYNGEIYNYIELREELKQKGYSFQTKSDTEVLVNAYDCWGEECVTRFNGMWAFAILNETGNKLFCSRDRFGEKPFNYFADNDKFIFGSEIKSIITYDNSLTKANYNAIALYCREGICGEIPETWYENILRLLPGHNLVINAGKISIYKYYNYPVKTINKSFEEAKKEFYELFIDSIKIRMRSDVPIGSTLSGGLDSSSIVAGMRTFYDGRHETFTAHFPGFLQDELATADKTNKIYNLVGNSVNGEFNEDYITELKTIIYHLESGNLSSSILPIWKVFEKAKSKVTILFEGQGADELIAGYVQSFAGTFILEKLRKLRFGDALRAINLLRKNYLLSDIFIFHLRLSLPSFFKTLIRRYILGFENILIGKLKNFKYTYSPSVKSDSTFKEKIQKVHQTTLVSLLHYSDAISMAHGIETRLPFLDFRLVDLVLTLPNNFFIAHGRAKYILREAVKSILPDYINKDVEKLGYPTPIDDFFINNKLLVEKILLDDKTVSRGLFDTKKLRKLIFSNKASFTNNGPFIFRLICVELWFRTFFDSQKKEENKNHFCKVN